MPRILPITGSEITDPLKQAFENHVRQYKGRITNMKATLGHSLLSFEVYMQWYPLYRETEKILGGRLSYLYAYAISYASDCPLCSMFFRKIIIDASEDPGNLRLSDREQHIIDFGAAIATGKGHVADDVYNNVSQYFSGESMVVLVAFAGQMIATNIFNNTIETDIDEYLQDYVPVVLKTGQ